MKTNYLLLAMLGGALGLSLFGVDTFAVTVPGEMSGDRAGADAALVEIGKSGQELAGAISRRPSPVVAAMSQGELDCRQSQAEFRHWVPGFDSSGWETVRVYSVDLVNTDSVLWKHDSVNRQSCSKDLLECHAIRDMALATARYQSNGHPHPVLVCQVTQTAPYQVALADTSTPDGAVFWTSATNSVKAVADLLSQCKDRRAVALALGVQ